MDRSKFVQRARFVAVIGVSVSLWASVAPAAQADPGKGSEMIAFTSRRDRNFEIYRMQNGGQDETNLTNTLSHEVAAASAANGTKLAFATLRGGTPDIYRMDPDGSNQTPLIAGPTSSEYDPAYSPDGTRIAFSSDMDEPGDLDIYVANADGTGAMQLTGANGPNNDEIPTWSPDSQFIAFDSGNLVTSDVYVVPATGGPAVNITNHPAIDRQADWSPQGNWIAWSSDRDGDYEIYKAHPDGTGLTQLTVNTWGDFDPAWSPSGGRIAFGSNPAVQEDIYVMNQNGNGIKQLTDNLFDDEDPDWQMRDESTNS